MSTLLWLNESRIFYALFCFAAQAFLLEIIRIVDRTRVVDIRIVFEQFLQILQKFTKSCKVF